MSDRVNDTFNDLLADLDGTIRRLTGAQGEPDARKEARYFDAHRRGYAKAQHHWLQGVRPLSTGTAYLVPSGSRAGVVHRISRVGYVLTCDCEAAQNERLCWHKLLVETVELAGERMDAFDDPSPEPAADPEPEPPRPAPALRLVRPDLGDDAEYVAWLARAA